MTHPSSSNSAEPTPNSGNQLLSITGTGRVTQFHCPCCDGSALEVGRLAEVEVCFCPKCNGFVMDNGTCGTIVSTLRGTYCGPDQTPKPLDPKQLEVRVKCPACRETMEVHPYYGPGNSVIDSCMHCKLVWFNEKELEQIIRAPGLRQVRHTPIATRQTDLLKAREINDETIDRAFVDAATLLVRSFLG